MAFSVGLMFSGCLESGWFTTYLFHYSLFSIIIINIHDLAEQRHALARSGGEAGASAQAEDATTIGGSLSDLRLGRGDAGHHPEI